MNPEGELILSLKMEDKYSLANVDEITKVPGIAWGEWGPGDQAMSLMGLEYSRAAAPTRRTPAGDGCNRRAAAHRRAETRRRPGAHHGGDEGEPVVPLHSSSLDNIIEQLIKAGIMVTTAPRSSSRTRAARSRSGRCPTEIRRTSAMRITTAFLVLFSRAQRWLRKRPRSSSNRSSGRCPRTSSSVSARRIACSSIS